MLLFISIRGIERRLTATPAEQNATCASPERPSVESPPLRDPDIVLHNEHAIDVFAMGQLAKLIARFQSVTTMMQAVGMEVSSFGEGPHEVTEPISEIMA